MAKGKNNLYRILFEQAADAILLLEDGYIVEANSQAFKRFGNGRHDLIGQSLLDLSAPGQPDGRSADQLLSDRINKALAGEPQEFEWVYRANNVLSTVYVNLDRLDIGKRSLIRVVLHDSKARQQRRGDSQQRLDSLPQQNPVNSPDQQEVERLLARRLRYEGGLAAASQALLTNTADALQEAIQHLLQATNTSRVHIFQNFTEPVHDLCVRQIYQAAAPDLPVELVRFGLQRIPYQPLLARWQTELAAGRPVGGPLATFTPTERQLLEPEGILSLLLLPITVKGQWYGFIGFDDTKTAKVWNDEDVKLLETAAGMIGAYIERRQTEEALRESEARSRAILDAIPDLMFQFDKDGVFLDYKAESDSKLALPPSTFLGRKISDIFPPEIANPALEAIDQALQTGQMQAFEYRLVVPGSQQPEDYEARVIARSTNEVLLLARNITEQKRLEEEIQGSLERRGRQVQLVTQVAQEIATATNLDDLYRRMVNQIKEQFGYSHVQLLRYDPALDTMALVVGYGEVGEKMLAMNYSMPMGVGLIGVAAVTGKSVLCPNVAQDPNWQPNPLLPDTKGELAVPIKLRNQVLGVLDVQSNIADMLGADDQLLLEGLCGQIAVAIESTSLNQEMEARLRELSTLQRFMSREGWDSYAIAKSGTAGYWFDHTGVQPINQTNGKQKLTPANARLVSQPLSVRGEVIGTLALQDEPSRPLTAEDKIFLEAVSEQVAEALEAARLFEQTQSALAEQERLSSELATVAEVSTAASTILEIDTLLQSVVDLAKTSFNLYHAHVYLFDEESQAFSLKAGAGDIGRLMTLEGREISLDAESLVARAGRLRRGVIENDVRKAVDFLPHPLLPETRAEMAIPMIVGDKLVGVLDLQSDQVGHFTTKDMEIHQTLASQIAVAAQNAYLYAEQVETAKQLRDVDRLKSEFLASMSHELRTPLNSIIGFADVLLEGLDGELNERMEQDVKLIRDSGRHLRELIGDILDMSKIEAGMMELRYEQVDMVQMANDVMATASPLAQDKALDMYLDIGEDVGSIYADRTRLRQILWNMVGNAIKFTQKGQVTLSMQRQEDNLLVSIRDTGIGIKPEDIPVIFEQFRQLDGNLNRTSGGTGLGLPISRRLVELHGGSVWVESVLGEGSTFWFTIPCRPAARKPDTGSLTLNYSS